MGQLHHPEARGGGVAWTSLVGGIVSYDCATKHETLTNAYRRFYEAHPVGATAILLTVGLHLMGKFPEGTDPIEKVFEHLPHHT